MKLLREYIREMLKEQNVLAAGMCFPFAAKKAEVWFDQHFEARRGRAPKRHPDLNNMGKFKVVHGKITDQWKSPPKPIVHAWVEMGDLVFDDQTRVTKPDGVPKGVYYDMYQPEVVGEYSAEEVVVNCIMKGEGPWDESLLNTMKQRDAWLNEKFNSEDFKDVYATARMAHMGQKRRSGEDYFSHPSEVRNIVRRFYPKDHVSQLAALLHDSLEDAPGLSVDSTEEMEEFIRGSISSAESATEIIRVVRALTHEKGGDYLSYVVSLLGDQSSLRVKLADMLHNLSSTPSPKQKKKYQSALAALSDASNSNTPDGISSRHWDSLLSLAHKD